MTPFNHTHFHELINREELHSISHLFTHITNHKQYIDFERNSLFGKCDKLWSIIDTVIDLRFDYAHYVEFYNSLNNNEYGMIKFILNEILKYKHYCDFSNVLGNDVIKNYYEYCDFYDNISNDKLKNVIHVLERLY